MSLEKPDTAALSVAVNTRTKHTRTAKNFMKKRKTPNLVRYSEIVRLRRLSKRSLKHWTREMKRAEKTLCSGDERNARNSVVWLNGYLKALDDVEKPND